MMCEQWSLPKKTSAINICTLWKGRSGNRIISETKYWMFVTKVTEIYAPFGKHKVMIARTC